MIHESWRFANRNELTVCLNEAIQTTEKLHSFLRRIKASDNLQDAMVYVDAAIALIEGPRVEERRTL